MSTQTALSNEVRKDGKDTSHRLLTLAVLFRLNSANKWHAVLRQKRLPEPLLTWLDIKDLAELAERATVDWMPAGVLLDTLAWQVALVGLWPVRTSTGEIVAGQLKATVARTGFPRLIISDDGRDFGQWGKPVCDETG